MHAGASETTHATERKQDLQSFCRGERVLHLKQASSRHRALVPLGQQRLVLTPDVLHGNLKVLNDQLVFFHDFLLLSQLCLHICQLQAQPLSSLLGLMQVSLGSRHFGLSHLSFKACLLQGLLPSAYLLLQDGTLVSHRRELHLQGGSVGAAAALFHSLMLPQLSGGCRFARSSQLLLCLLQL